MLFNSHNGLVEFDSAGRFVREIGAISKEAGGYLRVSSLSGDSLDNITLWDPWARRVTAYSPTARTESIFIRDDNLVSVRTSGLSALGIFAPKGSEAGDRVFGTVARINTANGHKETLTKVVTLATRNDKSEFILIPSFFWREPVWSVSSSGSFAYLVPDTALRLEIYDADGSPHLLITGQFDSDEIAITPAVIRDRVNREFELITQLSAEDTRSVCAKFLRSGIQNVAEGNVRTVHCATLRYLENVGRRSPRFFPSVTGLVIVSPDQLWLQTSRSVDDSSKWLIVDSSGQLTGYTLLSRSQTPIGGTKSAIALFDSSRGATTVAWMKTTRAP